MVISKCFDLSILVARREDYEAQLEKHLEYCRVETQELMQACLLAWISPQIYAKVRKSLGTKKPSDCSFAELKDATSKLYTQEIQEVAARYRFSNTRMKPRQSYDDWIAELWDVSKGCNFFKSEVQDEQKATEIQIGDRVILNSPHEEIRRSAFQHKNLTLEKLRTIINSYDVSKQALEIAPKMDSVKSFVQKIYQNKFKREHNRNDFIAKCKYCARKHLEGKTCWARNAKCFKCGKSGHFARCCLSATGANQIKDVKDGESVRCDESGYHEEDDELERHIYTIPGRKRAEISAFIEGVKTKMEFETGAAD
ncbi:hypothetical protein ACOME3_004463 [Neoechinorhynchus agilis]